MTVGDDKTIKVWGAEEESWSDLPRDTVVSKNMVTGLTISASGDTFATCGEATQLWTRGRHVPSRTFQWGVDTIHHVRFNPVETHLLGATSADRYSCVTCFSSLFLISGIENFIFDSSSNLSSLTVLV